MSKKFKVSIEWGITDSKVRTYYFDTEKEMKSFLHGVEEASGWWEYKISKEAA